MKKILVGLFVASLSAGSMLQAGPAFDKALDRKSYSSDKECAISLNLLATFLFGKAVFVNGNKNGLRYNSNEQNIPSSLGIYMSNFAANLLFTWGEYNFFPVAGKAAEEVSHLYRPESSVPEVFEAYKALYTKVYKKIIELQQTNKDFAKLTKYWTLFDPIRMKFGELNWEIRI